MTSLQATAEDRIYLEYLRYIYKTEMQHACQCIYDKEKIELAAKWKKKYPESTYKELIKMAKDPKSRAIIANWDVDNFRSTSK